MRRRLCCAVAVALLAAGCGSAADQNTRQTAPQPGATPATSAFTQTMPIAAASAATATATEPSRSKAAAQSGGNPAGGSAAAAHARSGATANSGSAGVTSAGSAGATSAGSAGGAAPAPPTPVRRFTYLANMVCRDAGSGGPLRAVPSTPAQLRGYIRQALPQARRMNLSLQRLSAQTGNTTAVSQLVLDYQALLSVYRQANGTASAASARSISAAQNRAAASARKLHLPLCAPIQVSAH